MHFELNAYVDHGFKINSFTASKMIEWYWGRNLDRWPSTRGAIWRTNIQQPGLDSITDRARGSAPSGSGRSPATKRFLVHFELNAYVDHGFVVLVLVLGKEPRPLATGQSPPGFEIFLVTFSIKISSD